MDKKRLLVIIGIIFLFFICICFSLIYYKDKYKVEFETGTTDKILTKYVKKGEKIKEPCTPIKDGYIFLEWQCDGKKYEFSNGVTEDTVLTAKWIKDEHININFITNSEYKIDQLDAIKGEEILLPDSNKDEYNFLGWSIDGEIIQDSIFYNNTTLTAEYYNDRVNTTYKIGDEVLVIDKYASASYSKYAYNKRAIGWRRIILDINYDMEFPYVVGDTTGVLGYFKASAIKKDF